MFIDHLNVYMHICTYAYISACKSVCLFGGQPFPSSNELGKFWLVAGEGVCP